MDLLGGLGLWGCTSPVPYWNEMCGNAPKVAA